MSMLCHYILDDEHHLVSVDLMTWAHWFENISNHVVAWTQVTSEITVSTVFLGLDHRFGGKGPPIVFETLVFGGPTDAEGSRTCSWDDALVEHAAHVRKARVAIGQKVTVDE